MNPLSASALRAWHRLPHPAALAIATLAIVCGTLLPLQPASAQAPFFRPLVEARRGL